MRRFTDAAALLHDLLDRLEVRPGSVRVIAHVDYQAFESTAAEDAFFDRLEVAARVGAIALATVRRDGVCRVERVRLADAAALYRHLGRAPVAEVAARALAALRDRADLPPAGQACLDEVEASWRRRVGWCGLAPGQAPALGRALDLALALGRRAAGVAADVDYRTFSRQATGDSKALEQLMQPVARLAHLLFAGPLATAPSEPEELLAWLKVARLAQPLLVSGSISLRNQVLPEAPYWGLPAEEALALRPAAPVDYVLTVENFTSFVRHAREINAQARGLVLYTGGFPARASLAALVEIAAAASAPIFHWGDIDPGGLRIFRHLERALDAAGLALRPHLMSEEILRAQGVTSLGEPRSLAAGEAADSAIGSLWDCLATGCDLRMEQEALDPVMPDLSRDLLRCG